MDNEQKKKQQEKEEQKKAAHIVFAIMCLGIFALGAIKDMSGPILWPLLSMVIMIGIPLYFLRDDK